MTRHTLLVLCPVLSLCLSTSSARSQDAGAETLLTPLLLADSQSSAIYDDDDWNSESDELFDVSFPKTALGLRVGTFQFSDNLADEIFGNSFLVGFDAKHHIGDTPLGISASTDLAIGSGDVQEFGTPVGLDTFQLSLRVTGYLEPPPGFFSTDSGNFWVNPYLGAGVGVHFVDVSASALGARAAVSDVAVGYHLVAGADFVFSRRFSIGPEILWTSADLSDMDFGSDSDVGGLTVSASLKFWF